MSWSYLPQCGCMLPTVLHIKVLLSSLSHEECYLSFLCRYATYLLLQNVHIVNINYAFEFISEMSHLCVPALCSHPYVKHWVKVLTFCQCSTLKKNLFAYTHKSK